MTDDKKLPPLLMPDIEYAPMRSPDKKWWQELKNLYEKDTPNKYSRNLLV